MSLIHQLLVDLLDLLVKVSRARIKHLFTRRKVMVVLMVRRSLHFVILAAIFPLIVSPSSSYSPVFTALIFRMLLLLLLLLLAV